MRGGVATSLNELARDCGAGVLLFEDRIPVRDMVRGACELLGLDPLHIANEGQFLAVVSAEYADAALAALHNTPGGEEAVLIGEIRAQPPATVLGTTGYGPALGRVLDGLFGGLWLSPVARRRRNPISPERTRVFTVPMGWASCTAISVMEYPEKYANSITRRCSKGSA